MVHVSVSLRALVFVLLLAAITVTSADVARGAPAAAEQTGFDGMLFTNPGQNGARDVHTDSSTTGGANLGGVRIYAGNTLTNPPTTAALQFYGNGHTVFGGQAYIDSGALNTAAIIFRTAPSGGVAERMRVTANGRVGIGTTDPQYKLHVDGGIFTALAGFSTNSIGVYGKTDASLGVYGEADTGTGVKGVSNAGSGVYGESGSGYGGEFQGNVKITGEIRDTTDVCYQHCPSDARLKQDITPLNPVLASLTALQPVRFHWRTDRFPEMHFPMEEATGLIAQEVEQVMPELVFDTDKGYRGVRYEQLPVLLLQGLKEVTAEKDALQDRVGALEEHNAALVQQNASLEARLAAIEQRLNGGTVPLVAAR